MIRVLKGIVLVVVIIVMAFAGTGVYSYFTSSSAVNEAISTDKGEGAIGELAGKLTSGQEVSDAEVASALGVSEESYAQAKATLEKYGVDLSNREQLASLVNDNVTRASELASFIGDVAANEVAKRSDITALLNQYGLAYDN